jgi:hypothetical protein
METTQLALTTPGWVAANTLLLILTVAGATINLILLVRARRRRSKLVNAAPDGTPSEIAVAHLSVNRAVRQEWFFLLIQCALIGIAVASIVSGIPQELSDYTFYVWSYAGRSLVTVAMSVFSFADYVDRVRLHRQEKTSQ